jgi:hypothetical protein
MWWTPLGLFGPLTIVVFVLLCMAVMFVMMRMMHRHGGASMWAGVTSCCGGAHLSSHVGDTHGASDRVIRPGSTPSSAFDEYRAETLRRLEEEQGEFQEFLDRLRKAKDKAEFDQFMAERHVQIVQA